MTRFTWTMYIVLAVGLAAGTVVTITRWFRRRILADYARRFDLEVPEELESRLRRRAGAPFTATCLGGLVGLTAGAVISALVIPPPDYSRQVPPVDPSTAVMIVTALSGGVIFQVVTAVALALHRPTGRRVARSTTPRLSDYVSGVERSAGWIVVCAAVILLVSIAVAERSGALHNPVIEEESVFGSMGAFFAYVSIGGLIVGSLLSRVVLHGPQPAGSSTELAWDDALRAQTLRGLVGLPLTWGIYSLLQSFAEIMIGSTWHPRALAYLFVVMALAACAATVGYLYSTRRSVSDRYFRRRLWSTEKLAAR
ncbi:hypothetical protein GCM10011575_29630 [Microlunatus endophyticus]|uniref:Uncharacterized protein n=1 Tax=Microlunatus endophyticus TaxID=1716077 RepID=A0A917SBW5_9ACTN|nr:hypothetical protein [Microlunatus endophyticus]GGL69076.1 hypothetical protein GCM10011575_29630 [Microlunatus endophyticus]